MSVVLLSFFSEIHLNLIQIHIRKMIDPWYVDLSYNFERKIKTTNSFNIQLDFRYVYCYLFATIASSTLSMGCKNIHTIVIHEWPEWLAIPLSLLIFHVKRTHKPIKSVDSILNREFFNRHRESSSLFLFPVCISHIKRVNIEYSCSVI